VSGVVDSGITLGGIKQEGGYENQSCPAKKCFGSGVCFECEGIPMTVFEMLNFSISKRYKSSGN
jgi:hypothetical protein